MTRKEAINTLRNIYQTDKMKEALGVLIPELRESEDEKIRNDIMEAVENWLPYERVEDIRAWLEKHKEQKPAEWSKEDEKIINLIVSILGQYIDYKAESGTGSGYATPRYSKEIAWLKSLRPQSKQEWSEEDEARYLSCLHRLETGNQSQPETVNSKWFKEHVHPRSSWRPSEEQIRSLEYFIKLWGDSNGQLKYTKIFNDVKSLREQLEKL